MSDNPNIKEALVVLATEVEAKSCGIGVNATGKYHKGYFGYTMTPKSSGDSHSFLV